MYAYPSELFGLFFSQKYKNKMLIFNVLTLAFKVVMIESGL